MNNIDPTRFGQIDQLASRAGEGTMYGGAATTGVAWAMSANGMIAIAGLAIAFIGFCTSFYFNLRRNQRDRERRDEERALHALQIAKLTHIEEKVDHD